VLQRRALDLGRIDDAGLDQALELAGLRVRSRSCTRRGLIGDAAYVSQALGIIARARGTTAVARDAAVTREALYKALSENGDPRLTTLLGVARALGVTVTARVDAEP
jgi:probable addiction module antidote protein